MIESIINYISVLSGGNDMVAGALTLAVSGGVGWFITTLPRTITAIVKAQLITTLTFNNTDWNKKATFNKVSAFLHELTTERGTRTLSIDSCWVEGKDIMVLTMGWGNHFFFYKNRFMWLKRAKLESSGSENLKEEITLSVLGRSHEIFRTLVEENKPDEDDNLLNFSEYKDGWSVKGKVKKQSLKSLALNPETVETFVAEVEYFLNNEEDYTELGLPYKLTMVLHGVSGSGKSSVIRSLASDYNMNLCNLPLSGMSDQTFRDALNTVPKNSLVMIEDFDSCGAVGKRQNVTGVDNTKGEDSVSESFSFLTLSGILNALDGVSSLNGTIVVLTTNCIDNIDTALLREGRVDFMTELPEIRGSVVKEHLEKLYGVNINFNLKDMSAKEISALKFKVKMDGVKLLELLKDVHENK